MQAIPINEHHHTREELERIARNCKDEHWSRRIRGIIMAMSGLSRTVSAGSQGVSAQTLRDWIMMYNAHGVEGLRPRSRVSRPCRLQEDSIKVLMACIEDGLAREDGLQSRLRVCDIRALIGNAFEICYSWEGTRRLLHRLGLSWISTPSDSSEG